MMYLDGEGMTSDDSQTDAPVSDKVEATDGGEATDDATTEGEEVSAE